MKHGWALCLNRMRLRSKTTESASWCLTSRAGAREGIFTNSLKVIFYDLGNIDIIISLDLIIIYIYSHIYIYIYINMRIYIYNNKI